MMACAEGGGGDLPPVLTEDGEVPAVSPPDKEVPPVSPPENEAPPVSPPGFVSTPGCEYKCNGVEEGAKTCDSDSFKGCKCVFADPSCISECDDGGWRMACADGGGETSRPYSPMTPPASSQQMPLQPPIHKLLLQAPQLKTPMSTMATTSALRTCIRPRGSPLE